MLYEIDLKILDFTEVIDTFIRWDGKKAFESQGEPYHFRVRNSDLKFIPINEIIKLDFDNKEIEVMFYYYIDLEKSEFCLVPELNQTFYKENTEILYSRIKGKSIIEKWELKIIYHKEVEENMKHLNLK